MSSEEASLLKAVRTRFQKFDQVEVPDSSDNSSARMSDSQRCSRNHRSVRGHNADTPQHILIHKSKWTLTNLLPVFTQPLDNKSTDIQESKLDLGIVRLTA